VESGGVTSLRAVVLGTGSIGQRHLRLLQAREDVVVTALPSREARVAALREEGFSAEASWRDVGDVDIAIIATDTGRHAADLRTALDHGARTVLVEKPLVAHVAQLSPPAGEAQVYVGYNLRFAGAVQKVRSLLPELGALHAAEVVARSWLPSWRPGRDHRASYSARPDEGGVLRDLSHEVDLALWLFGGVSGRPRGAVRTTGRIEIEADDVVALGWTSPSGVEVSVALDYLTRPPRRGISVYGERGRVEMNLLDGTVRALDVDGAERIWTVAADDIASTYPRQLDELVRAAGGELPTTLATWDDGRAVVELSDAVRSGDVEGGGAR
jgi:predicted dehydrogenase